MCIDAGEPSLAVLVVGKSGGEPGRGFTAGKYAWFTEAQRCFEYWSSR